MDNKYPVSGSISRPVPLLFYADFSVGTVTKRFIGGSAAAAQVNVVFFGFCMTRRILKGKQPFDMNRASFRNGYFHCLFFHNAMCLRVLFSFKSGFPVCAVTIGHIKRSPAPAERLDFHRFQFISLCINNTEFPVKHQRAVFHDPYFRHFFRICGCSFLRFPFPVPGLCCMHRKAPGWGTFLPP